jgi:uncharacterized protein (TIGR00266 family)
MRYEMIGEGAYPAVRVSLGRGDRITAEAGAMASMDGCVNIETEMKGGLLGGLKRSVLGGESFFMNHFTSSADNGELVLAPTLPGSLRVREMHGETVFLQSGSFLASFGSVEVDTKWKGFKGFFSGEGFFMLRITGSGTLFYNSFGAMYDVQVNGGPYRVDTGNIVMFDEGLDYRVASVGGLKSLVLSGEGLVAEFTGKGTLVMQTRSIPGFVSWITGKMPKKSGG